MDYQDIRTRNATDSEKNIVTQNIQFDYEYLNEVLFDNTLYDYFITAWIMKIEFNDGTTRPVIIYFIKYNNDIYLFADEYELREPLPTDVHWLNVPNMGNLFNYFNDKKNLRLYAYLQLGFNTETDMNNPASKIIKGHYSTISYKVYTLKEFKSDLTETDKETSLERLIKSFYICKDRMYRSLSFHQLKYSYADDRLFNQLGLPPPDFDYYDLKTDEKKSLNK